MPIIADTGAITYGGKTFFYDDPAESLPGWPGSNAILSSRKVNFTLTNLGTTQKTYTSGDKSDIIALANFYAPRGATVDIEEGPVYKLTVVLPYDEIANLDADPTRYALWEVTPNMSERDIFEVGIYSPSVQNGLISQQRVVVNNTIKGAIDYAVKNPLLTVNLTVKPEWASKDYIARNFQALKRLKADGILAFTQTVKRTFIVDTLYTQQTDPIAASTVGNISPLVCTADLIAQYSVPANIQVYLLPSYARKKTVTGEDAVDLFVLAGYLAKKPTYQQVTPNKIQITQEFLWDEWLDSLYRPWDGNYSKFTANTIP